MKHEVTGHFSEQNGNVEMSILGRDSVCYVKPFIHRNKKSSPIQHFKIIYRFTLTVYEVFFLFFKFEMFSANTVNSEVIFFFP